MELFLLPVVQDVLNIDIIFLDVDELFHQSDLLFGLQLLIVLGNHFQLCGSEGVLAQVSNHIIEVVGQGVMVNMLVA